MPEYKVGSIGTGYREDYDELVICPRCQDNLLPQGYPGAISRIDNETEICSPCGTDEGMRDYFDGVDMTMTTDKWPVNLRYHLHFRNESK